MFHLIEYSNFSWAVTKFTESESTYANSSSEENHESTKYEKSKRNNIPLLQSHANGSFSFQSFSAALSATAGSQFQETGHGGGWVSYSVNNSNSHSVSLKELGIGQLHADLCLK